MACGFTRDRKEPKFEGAEACVQDQDVDFANLCFGAAHASSRAFQQEIPHGLPMSCESVNIIYKVNHEICVSM